MKIEVDLEKLDAVIERLQIISKFFRETPAPYLNILSKEGDIVRPKVDDVLLRSGEAAQILGVSKSAIHSLHKAGKLRGYYVAGSNHVKFWRSEVKALATEKGNDDEI